MEAVTDFTFLDSIVTADSEPSHEIKRCSLLGRKAMTNPDNILKSRNITLPTKIYVDLVFPVVMRQELDHKEGWRSNWCFWIVVLEKTLESPLDSKEIKSVNPKGNQPWILIGSTVAEAEAPILLSPDGKSLLIGKDPDAEKRLKANEEGDSNGWNY